MPINSNLIKKYYKNTMIETGSFLGHGIQSAIDSNIQKIYSIELSEMLYKKCKIRFESFNNVKLVNGNSGIKLRDILTNVKSTCLFWLDAHYSAGITAGEGLESPLYSELDAIKNHFIKSHTIMIDDIRSEDKKKLKLKLLEINPNYKIVLEDSYQDDKLLFEKDIMVAYI